MRQRRSGRCSRNAAAAGIRPFRSQDSSVFLGAHSRCLAAVLVDVRVLGILPVLDSEWTFSKFTEKVLQMMRMGGFWAWK